MIRFLLSKGANKFTKNYLMVPPINMYSNRFEIKEVSKLLSVDKEEELKKPSLHHLGVMPTLQEDTIAEKKFPDFKDSLLEGDSKEQSYVHDVASGLFDTKLDSEEPLLKDSEKTNHKLIK